MDSCSSFYCVLFVDNIVSKWLALISLELLDTPTLDKELIYIIHYYYILLSFIIIAYHCYSSSFIIIIYHYLLLLFACYSCWDIKAASWILPLKIGLPSTSKD